MAKLQSFTDFIREKVEKESWTHAQLSDHFHALYPAESGFSVRSIQRLCNEKGIKRTSRISDADLDVAVSEAINKVIFVSLMNTSHTYHLCYNL